MKKLFSIFFLSIIFISFIFSESYKIVDQEITVDSPGFKFFGKTKEYSILTKYPIDKKTIFSDIESLEQYLTDYTKKLDSSRAFDSLSISYETSFDNTEAYNKVILKFDIVDSHHLLVLPYGKYSSNTGLSIKLKAKDTNFIGSLNTLSADLNLAISEDGFIPGLTFSYDNPFKLGIFDATWVNDYTLSYSLNEQTPEWDLKTGLKLSLPFEKFSFVMEFYQYFYKEMDYKVFDDDMYFAEEVSFSLPVTVAKLKNYSNLIYTPKISGILNWDFDGISEINDYLSSPTITIGHSLENSNIIWENFYRSGYSLKLVNTFIYNVQRQDLSPYIEFEGKYFNNWKLYNQNYWDRYGICINLYGFTYIDLPMNSYYYGNKIGERLRGILDNTYFGNDRPLYTTSTAIVLNIDLPHHILTTNFSKQIFNFDLQFSPFIDIALIQDRSKDSILAFEDGKYCAGLEILVFPLKWSSYTVRASLGTDLQKALSEPNLLQGLSKYKELFIGIGLHY